MKLSFLLPKPMLELLSKPYQDEQTTCTNIDSGMEFWNVADGRSVKKRCSPTANSCRAGASGVGTWLLSAPATYQINGMKIKSILNPS